MRENLPSYPKKFPLTLTLSPIGGEGKKMGNL